MQGTIGTNKAGLLLRNLIYHNIGTLQMIVFPEYSNLIQVPQ